MFLIIILIENIMILQLIPLAVAPLFANDRWTVISNQWTVSSVQPDDCSLLTDYCLLRTLNPPSPAPSRTQAPMRRSAQ